MSAAPRTDIVAVIPAYNCAVTIGEVVAGAARHVARVVVGDDGSTDGTGPAARRAGAQVVAWQPNRGKGYALGQAFAAALAMDGVAAVVMLDGDAQHDPDDLPGFFAAWDTGRWDLLVGTRLADRAAVPAHRWWTNTIGSRLLTVLTGVTLEDSQSGYRLIDAGLLARLPLGSKGYAIESEMLIKASRRGARIGHVPVRTIYHSRVPSYYQPVRDTLRITCSSIYHRLTDRE